MEQDTLSCANHRHHVHHTDHASKRASNCESSSEDVTLLSRGIGVLHSLSRLHLVTCRHFETCVFSLDMPVLILRTQHICMFRQGFNVTDTMAIRSRGCRLEGAELHACGLNGWRKQDLISCESLIARLAPGGACMFSCMLSGVSRLAVRSRFFALLVCSHLLVVQRVGSQVLWTTVSLCFQFFLRVRIGSVDTRAANGARE